MNNLRRSINKSINLYFSKYRDFIDCDSLNELIISNIHDESSHAYLQWKAFLNKMNFHFDNKIRDVTVSQFPAFILEIELEKTKVKCIEYTRSIYIHFSLIDKYFTVNERVILKTKVDEKYFETFLLINTSPSDSYLKEHSLCHKEIELHFEKWRFVPAAIWKVKEESYWLPKSYPQNNKNIFTFLFGPMRNYQFSIGNDYYIPDH